MHLEKKTQKHLPLSLKPVTAQTQQITKRPTASCKSQGHTVDGDRMRAGWVMKLISKIAV